MRGPSAIFSRHNQSNCVCCTHRGSGGGGGREEGGQGQGEATAGCVGLPREQRQGLWEYLVGAGGGGLGLCGTFAAAAVEEGSSPHTAGCWVSNQAILCWCQCLTHFNAPHAMVVGDACPCLLTLFSTREGGGRYAYGVDRHPALKTRSIFNTVNTLPLHVVPSAPRPAAYIAMGSCLDVGRSPS
jgi:hypothetical protein